MRDGIDPSAYTLDAAARDLADLRRVLGVDQWDLVSWGSSSRVLVQYAALEPEAVHAMSLDSPQLPGADPVAGAGADLDRAIAALEVACSGAPGCPAPTIHLSIALHRAARRLEASPVRVTVADHEVVVGGAALVRVVRDLFASEPSRAGDLLPRIVRSALKGRVRSVADAIVTRPGSCIGYLPLCEAPVSLGAYLSMVCTERSAAGLSYPGYGEEHPLLAGCRAWDVRSSSVGSPPEVPTMVLWGDLDPFVPSDLGSLAQAELADPHVVLVPGAGHDTVGYLDCLRAVRNDWLLHAERPPSYLDCLRESDSITVS